MQICWSKDLQNQRQLWGHRKCDPSESQRFHPEDYWGNFPNSLLDEIVEIQKARICCDLKVVFDFGDLRIHRSILLLYGKSVWWASLLKESCSDVVILPGVSVTQVEVDKFILTIYGQNIVTGDKYSSDAETFHGFSDAKFWLQVAQLEIQLHPWILQDMIHCNGLQATVILGIWDQRRDKY